PRSLACCLCLPVGTLKCTPVTNQAEGVLSSIFRRMRRPGGWARRCGNQMFVPQLTPTSAFRLDSHSRFQPRMLQLSAEAPVNVRCSCGSIKRTFTFPCSHCFVVWNRKCIQQLSVGSVDTGGCPFICGLFRK